MVWQESKMGIVKLYAVLIIIGQGCRISGALEETYKTKLKKKQNRIEYFSWNGPKTMT